MRFALLLLLSGCGTPDGMQDDASPVLAQLAISRRKNEFVAEPDSSLVVGATLQLSSLVVRSPSRGVVKIEFRSSDPSVATVSPTGLISAIAPGVTTISIASHSAMVAFVLVVTAPPAPIDSTAPGNPPGAPGDSVGGPPTSGPGDPPPDFTGTLPPFSTPMLPAATVDVTVPAVTGRTIRVAANNAAALQSALNSAVGGDEIVLPNGSLYSGNFVLPKHAGAGIVTVRSETVGVAPGTRVSPATSSSFATIRTPGSDAALITAASASGWRLTGLRFLLAAGAPLNYGIVRLGTGSETTMDQFPSGIVLDRVYISAGTDGQTQRCIAFNGASLAVVNSWLADCHSKGFDTQGVGGWSGSGPYLIENNWIEGSGQAVLFGGADSRITNLTPSDITIRRNYMFKPLSWGNGKWTVKAAFELKHGRRVLFESNIIENHWADAQTGFAILFQALSDNNTAPWTKVQDVTVRNSIVRNSTGGMNLASRVAYGPDAVMPSEPSRRILVQNVLFQNVGIDPVTGAVGRILQLMSDHEDVTIMQNTFTSDRGRAAHFVILDGPPARRLLFVNNVFPTSEYGVFGSGKGEGKPALDFYIAGGSYTVTGNIFPGRSASIYPLGNAFPSSTAQVTFVNAAGGDFTLRDSPATPASSSNARVGVDGQRILSATANLSNP